jgi:MarR family transcriptional regulator, temperature-dependent positive regulator of motility
LSEERQFEALRFLEANPKMTQRELAEALGVSLGSTNYCLKALVEKGWLKLENFQRNPNKLGYLYLLTPTGITAKTHLTTRFLRRKLIEYEALKAEIAELQLDVEESARQSG